MKFEKLVLWLWILRGRASLFCLFKITYTKDHFPSSYREGVNKSTRNTPFLPLLFFKCIYTIITPKKKKKSLTHTSDNKLIREISHHFKTAITTDHRHIFPLINQYLFSECRSENCSGWNHWRLGWLKHLLQQWLQVVCCTTAEWQRVPTNPLQLMYGSQLKGPSVDTVSAMWHSEDGKI